MAQLRPAKEFKLCPAGEHIFTLKSAQSKECKSQYGTRTNDKGEKVADKLVWDFESNRIDEETGENYHYFIKTGFEYGNDKAALTNLMDMVVPGITYQEAVNYDTDTLIEKKFKGLIKHVTQGDKKYANHVYLNPLKPANRAASSGSKGKTVAPPNEDDLFNGDEGEGDEE